MNTEDRPTMEELRGMPRFPFEDFESNSPPMLVAKAWQTTLKATVPTDPTEDFYVGVEWMLSLLYVLMSKGLHISIPMLADLGIAIMKFKDNEENPFEDKLLFDSEYKPITAVYNNLADRVLERLREMIIKEKENKDE
jgi:hypothetical protein